MRLRLFLVLIPLAMLAACATPGGGYYSQGNQYHRPPYDGYARCQSCGVVERIERVYGERCRNGAGAVLDDIIVGVLGIQVGRGSGWSAATMAGAITGVAAGTAID